MDPDIQPKSLFHDSTIYFALISGILFSVALRRRGWPRFFRSKLSNVIAPYVVMSLLFTLVQWLGPHGSLSAGKPAAALAGEYLSNLWHGAAESTYWYIPVIVVLFAATPLLGSLVTGRHSAIGIIVVGALPLFVSRTETEVTGSTLVYFAGVYAVGMYLGDRYSENLAVLHRWRVTISTVAVASTAALLLLFARDLDMVGPVSLKESLFYLQKLAISALVLCSMQRREHQLPPVLDQLASHAFAIYFLHSFVVKVLFRLSLRVFPPPNGGGTIVILSLLMCCLALALCWMISRTVQAVFGRSSKWLIGA